MSATASLMALDEELTETMRGYQGGYGRGDSIADFEGVLRREDEDMLGVDDACHEFPNPASAAGEEEARGGARGDGMGGFSAAAPYGVSTENLGLLVFSTLQNLGTSQGADHGAALAVGRPTTREQHQNAEPPQASANRAQSTKQAIGRDGLRRADLSSDRFARRAPLQPTSFLAPGMTFVGTQEVSPLSKSESWDLRITVEEANFARGYVCGTMCANGFNCGPENGGQGTPVATFWEGDLVDNINHHFYTQKWGASKSIDKKHWLKLAPLCGALSEKQQGGVTDLAAQPYVYMRLKEKYFLDNEEPGGNLTIAGFYYLCISRRTGEVSGYYFDPNSTPYQKVSLQVAYEGSSGFSSAGGDLI